MTHLERCVLLLEQLAGGFDTAQVGSEGLIVGRELLVQLLQDLVVSQQGLPALRHLLLLARQLPGKANTQPLRLEHNTPAYTVTSACNNVTYYN